MISFNSSEVYKILKEIALKTYPDLKFIPYKLNIESKENKTKHGHWTYHKTNNTFEIHIYNLSRKTQHIISTTIHELAHHVDYCIRQKSGHDKVFYFVLKKLLEKAHELEYINLDGARNKIDSGDLEKIQKLYGFKYEKREIKEDENYIIKVSNFDLKEKLKENKYLYSPTEKQWLKEITPEEINKEKDFLSNLKIEKYEIIKKSENEIESIYYAIIGKGFFDKKELLKKENFNFDNKLGWYKKILAKEKRNFEFFCKQNNLTFKYKGNLK